MMITHFRTCKDKIQWSTVIATNALQLSDACAFILDFASERRKGDERAQVRWTFWPKNLKDIYKSDIDFRSVDKIKSDKCSSI